MDKRSESKGFATCPRCKSRLILATKGVCEKCEEAEFEDYNKVRDALEQHPECSGPELAEAAGVSLDCIKRMLARDMIVDVHDRTNVPACGVCGKPAISHKKKICAACLQTLRTRAADAEDKPSTESSQSRRMFDVHRAVKDRRKRE